MSFLSELTLIQQAGMGAVVVLLLVLLIVKRRQSAGAGGSKAAKTPKAEKPAKAKKAKKAKAEKPAKEKRSRRSKSDRGTGRRRRGATEPETEPASPLADVPPPPPTVPVAPVTPVAAAPVAPDAMPMPQTIDGSVPPPGWPAPGEAWVDPYGTSPAVFDPVPGADPGAEIFDPAAAAGQAEQAAWNHEHAEPAEFAGVDPTGQTQEWAQPEAAEWAPTEDTTWTASDDVAQPSQEWAQPEQTEWAQPEQTEWAQPDETAWAPEATEADAAWAQPETAADWTAQEQAAPAESEWAQPEAAEWDQQESEWAPAAEADTTSQWEQSDDGWTDDATVAASDEGWSEPEPAAWTEPSPVDDGPDDADVVPADLDWASDSDLPSADQLVSEATGIAADEDLGTPDPFVEESAWEPVDADDPSEVETSTFAAVSSDDPGVDDGFAASLSDEAWSPAPVIDGVVPVNGHMTPEPPLPPAHEDPGTVDEALPGRRPALETLHHLSARVAADETDFADDGAEDDIAPFAEQTSLDAPVVASVSAIREENPSSMSVDVDTAPYTDATPAPSPADLWNEPAPAEPAPAPAAEPVGHVPSPRRSWADMTPAPAKPAETLSPSQRWARLRPSTGPAPRPAVPAVAARPAPAPAAAPVAADAAGGDSAARRGRFALGGHATKAGQEIVSGVSYRSEVVPPPSRWLLGPATGPVPAGTLVLSIEGLVNCVEADLEVVMEPGFAPTVDGFSLRLRSKDEGSFAASGTFEIH